jgi:hypothetical protein
MTNRTQLVAGEILDGTCQLRGLCSRQRAGSRDDHLAGRADFGESAPL